MSAGKMSLLAAAPVILILSASAEAEKETPQSRAFQIYYGCLVQAVDRLDDGHSDASTIALTATAVCETEWVRMMATFKAAMRRTEADTFEVEWNSKRQPYAVGVVLKARSLQRR